ncbi:peptidylprolyl isomerase [bacterium]|nr:peptidylprolyl isomerase [bacterium]
MEKAKKGDKVKVHYTGKLDDGTVFDETKDRDPLEFTIGENNVIPGFENAVEGMEVGDSKTTNIPSDEAYGPHMEEGVLSVDRSGLQDDVEVEVGQQVQLSREDGQAVIATVVEANDEKITLDANHPLAGKDLTFDIELVEVVK